MAEHQEIAAVLGLSRRVVSAALQRWGVATNSMTVDDAVKLYVRQLAESAAGRGGMEDGETLDLAVERAKTERLKQEKLKLDIAEQSGELVRAAEFENRFSPMMDSFRSNALGIPGKVVQAIRVLKGIEIEPEIVEDVIFEFLKTCSEYGTTEKSESGGTAVREAGTKTDASSENDDN